jgi:hypothetical protein
MKNMKQNLILAALVLLTTSYGAISFAGGAGCTPPSGSACTGTTVQEVVVQAAQVHVGSVVTVPISSVTVGGNVVSINIFVAVNLSGIVKQATVTLKGATLPSKGLYETDESGDLATAFVPTSQVTNPENAAAISAITHAVGATGRIYGPANF